MFDSILNSLLVIDSNIQKDECFPSVEFVFLYNELTIYDVDSNVAFRTSSRMKNI